jgi:acyl-CoA reductase-like NAD-dependent aldehyde dehydrogenase
MVPRDKPNNDPRLFIGGKLADAASAERIDVVNPATEEVIGRIADASARDVGNAVTAAREAVPEWAAMPPAERARCLAAFADALDRHGQQVAATVTAQNGMPLAISRFANHLSPVNYYRYFAGLAAGHDEEETRTGPDGTAAIVRREPYGVVAAIVPWNAPHILLSWKVGPALASGNTVVVKPAPETSLDMAHYAEAAQEAGIPPGVINYVTGGRSPGEALVAHPGVGKIAFTGSTDAGRAIAAVAARRLVPATLELGGKSAAIIMDDADLSAFAAAIPVNCVANSGQICYSQTRILAPRSRYDEVVEVVAATMAALPVGDPLDPATRLGPLVTQRQRDRVERYIETGQSEGATLVTGGGRVKGQPRGWYIEPTVFRDVGNAMTIAREEIFGPVLVVIGYDDDADAVRLANDSDYGLGGAVYTGDAERGRRIARQVQTGSFGINRYAIAAYAPFGGYKQSGLGRELGPESLHAYTQAKSIYI